MDTPTTEQTENEQPENTENKPTEAVKPSMTGTAAIMTYFATDDLPVGSGVARPVTNSELLTFRRLDRKGYDEVGQMAADALGVTIAVTA